MPAKHLGKIVPKTKVIDSANLCGLHEIAEIAEPRVSTQAVVNWRARFEDFPKPVQVLKMGPVFDKAEVCRWLADTDRQ